MNGVYNKEGIFSSVTSMHSLTYKLNHKKIKKKKKKKKRAM